jgi:hypothetical protein
LYQSSDAGGGGEKVGTTFDPLQRASLFPEHKEILSIKFISLILKLSSER